jgi:hypothetical protein
VNQVHLSSAQWLAILHDSPLRTACRRSMLYKDLKSAVISKSGCSAARVGGILASTKHTISNEQISDAFMSAVTEVEACLESGRRLGSLERELFLYHEHLCLPALAETYLQQGRAATAEAAFRLRYLEIENTADELWPATAGHDTPTSGTSPAVSKQQANDESVPPALFFAPQQTLISTKDTTPVQSHSPDLYVRLGLYARVAQRLGLDRSHVRKVALGEYASRRVSSAIVQEIALLDSELALAREPAAAPTAGCGTPLENSTRPAAPSFVPRFVSQQLFMGVEDGEPDMAKAFHEATETHRWRPL